MLNNLNAEYSLVGSILLSPECLPEVREIIKETDLELIQSKRIYEECCKLYDASESYDQTVIGSIPGIDSDYVQQLCEATVTGAMAKQYAEIVHKNGMVRNLSSIGAVLANVNDEDYEESARKAIKDIEATLEGKTSGVIGSCESLTNYIEWVQKRTNGVEAPVASNIPAIDQALAGGFENGGLYIIGARPGVGKTSNGLIIADHIAMKRTVLYVTMEMPDVQLNARRIANAAGMPIGQAMGRFDKESERHWKAIGESASELSEHKLYFNTNSSCTINDIQLMARQVKAECIVIDYLGLINHTGKFNTQYEKITDISGCLKRMALSMNVPIIAMSQLNRNAANAEPSLQDLRDSGAIEQDADSVILLHRPEMNQYHDQKSFQPLHFIIVKNRNGPTGQIVMRWNGATGRLLDDDRNWKSFKPRAR